MVSTRNLINLIGVLLITVSIVASMIPLPYKRHHNLEQREFYDDDDDDDDWVDLDDSEEYDIHPRRQPNYRRRPPCYKYWHRCDGRIPCCGGRLCTCMEDVGGCYCTIYSVEALSPNKSRPDYLNFDLKDNTIG